METTGIHSLAEMNRRTDEGTAFIGKLIYKGPGGKVPDNEAVQMDENLEVLRFSIDANSILEDIYVHWMSKKELEVLNINQTYYVVEDIDFMFGSYALSIYDLTGKQVLHGKYFTEEV